MLRKVLVAEDNELNRVVLHDILEKDYDVIEAVNGKEAISILHRKHKMISAVLLDLSMPVMDGFEVLKQMRQNAVLSQIPVIVATGLTDKDAEIKALSLGANDFVTKPYQPALILHCLRNTINLRETASIVNAIQLDKLTGLYNRETFFNKAANMLKEHDPGYYMMACFDIDNFKVINDQFGAVEGDRILQHVGKVAKAGLNSIGGIGSRISADNFAALYPVGEKEIELVTRMREEDFALPDSRAVILYSVGRYIVTDLALPASALYDRAYIAKQSVKGRYDEHIAYFSESMRDKLIREQEIIGEMDAALTLKQFEIWLQPQFNHATGALIGAEALVRWRHPQRGLVSPGEFVPVFEQNGFIYELDKYVWEQTCALIRKWLDEGRNPLPVSVNISRYDIFRMDFFETITHLLRKYALTPDRLRLEITESAFAKSSEQMIAMVRRMMTYGFTVEIDDFGSGYSSLNTLKDVPATVLKLDMKFFEATGNSQRGGNIVESVVRMAKWLGMSVIAEGVEKREQADYLKSIGCSYIQGYLYARPMPVAQYERLANSIGKEQRLLALETVANLDNNAFWDPKSMDTLIFNSYVGGACIYEYHNGAIEMLRANDQYVQVIGSAGMKVEDALVLNWAEHLDEKDLLAVKAALRLSIDTGDAVTGEYVFRNLPGCPPETCLRSTMRVIASSGEHYLVYCTNENTTAQRLAERKEHEAVEQLRFLNETAHDLLAQPDTEKGLEYVLNKLLQYFDGDRAYIFELDHAKRIARNTYEACAQNVVPEKENLQSVTFEECRLWLRAFEQKSYIDIADVDALGDDRQEERRTLKAQGIRSLIAVPLQRDGRLIGFIGIDDPRQQHAHIDRLVALGDYIAVMLTRRDLDAKIVWERDKLERQRRELLDNLPCGAGICELSAGDVRAVYLNKRYQNDLKRDPESLSRSSVFEVIHPSDRQKLRDAIRPALSNGGEGTCDVRILDGAGDYLPFRIVGSAMEYAGDRNAIYVTFTPISKEEQTYAEMLPVALAAVVSSSQDMAFVKDRSHRYVCCNRAFALAMGLTSEKELAGKTDYDLVPAECADRYRQGEEGLVRDGGACLTYEETLPGTDGLPRYVHTTKYPLMDSGGNVIGFYGLSRDVTQARETDSQLKLLTDSIPGGLATYACTEKTVKILYFNDGFSALFGFTRAEYEKRSALNPISMVFEEDRPMLMAQVDALVQNGTPIECVYRAHINKGGYKWIHHRAVAMGRRGDTVTVNAVLLDVTQRQEAMERLRVSEEEHRLAVQHSDNILCRFSVAERTLTMSAQAAQSLSLPQTLADVPYGPVALGYVAPDSAEAYTGFFERILHGEKAGALVFQYQTGNGWRWLDARFSAILSAEGKALSAVVSFRDVTESLEKETVYKKWQQSLEEKEPASYTLFRCNLSKDASLDTKEGELLYVRFAEDELRFDERSAQYAAQCVCEEDQPRYVKMMRSGALLKDYYQGKRTQTIEYREKLPQGGLRWLRLTVDLVEYPNSTDVEAYLMYENIDEEKRAEMDTIERAQTDPLTGVLNRAAFTSRVEAIIRDARPGARHAMLMLDIDGFKLVNDVFGHAAGDQALVETALSVRSVLRQNDLLGRLGGDEFVVFLGDVPSDAVAVGVAKRICALVRKSFSLEVQISASVGIVICPRDGGDFDTLYRKADAALYYVKGSGKDSYAFYHDDMENEHLQPERDADRPTVGKEKKRRMLIVDDNKIDYQLLAHMFEDDFVVDRAKDGNTALIRLRHYGSAISVVLLDLLMPGMDGFAVLEKMQQNAELQAVPVIVVSGDENRETSLRAIRSGATDYVAKPVDAELLRIRVQSAVSKAENERLRARNSFLELASSEVAKYRTVLENTGTLLIEHDWINGTFSYDPNMASQIAGVWDQRKLWHILLSDMVTDVRTVKSMQELVHSIAEDRGRASGSIRVPLQTPKEGKHLFLMNVYKLANEYQLTDKLILTLNDTGDAPAK